LGCVKSVIGLIVVIVVAAVVGCDDQSSDMDLGGAADMRVRRDGRTADQLPTDSKSGAEQQVDGPTMDAQSTDGGCKTGIKQPCYSGPKGTENIGLCKAGTQTCFFGSWGPCVGEVVPKPELCDGQDGDCDGTADNGAACVLDKPPIGMSTATGSKNWPSVASDGTDFLVVWQDNRPGATGGDVYGARVSAAGKILDPAGIAIATGNNAQVPHDVAFVGSTYLVVWKDHATDKIYGTRLSKNGTVLDAAGIPISTKSGDDAAVATDTTNFLVVWSRGECPAPPPFPGPCPGYQAHILGARVTQGGSVLDTSGITVATGSESRGTPALAFDGVNYLVVWVDGRHGSTSNIYGARVSAGGAVLDPNGIPITATTSSSQNRPAVAFNGTDYVVVWEDNANLHLVYGTRVAPSGKVLDLAGIKFPGPHSSMLPKVVCHGTNCLVIWTNQGLFGARVSPTGQLVDPTGFPIPTTGAPTTPSLASGSVYLVVWSDFVQNAIYGARVSP
jgi:hypothetical protein